MSTACPIDRVLRWFWYALVGLLIATCARMAWGQTAEFIYPLRIGTRVSGTVTLQASVDGTVVKIQFWVDDTALGGGTSAIGPEITSAPWQMSWDSTTLTVGPHILRIKAWNAGGASALSTVGGNILIYRADDATAPVISSVTTNHLTSRSVIITWATDEYASSIVEYGTSTSYGTTRPLLVTQMYEQAAHSISLPDLSPSTTYHYRVRSTDGNGNEAVGSDHTFSTPADATIANAAGWTDLTSTHFVDLCTPNQPLYGFTNFCPGIINAFSSGIWDSIGKRLVIFGGGHNATMDNAVIALKLPAAAWERLRESSGTFISGNGINYGWSTCEGMLPDGNPCSRHTYNGLTFVPSLNTMWMYGGALQCNSGGGDYHQWSLDLSTLHWTQVATSGPAPQGASTIASDYDPVTGLVYVFGRASVGQLYTSNPSTGEWITRNAADGVGPQFVTAAIDPVGRRIIEVGDNVSGGGANNKPIACLLDSPYTCSSLSTTGATSTIEGSRSPGVQYDPARGTLVAWDANGDPTGIYELNLSTYVWTRTQTTGGPSSAGYDGGYGKWRYVSDLAGYLAAPYPSQDVYVYRFSAQPTNTPTPSATPSPSPTPTICTWHIGPAQTYTRPSQITSLVNNGDHVCIDAATYQGTDAIATWTTPNLTIIGIGGRPIFDATPGYAGLQGKGTWVFTSGANNASLTNLEFKCALPGATTACPGITLGGGGDAGVRLDGTAHGLTVRNCYFHDNFNGILATNNTCSISGAVCTGSSGTTPCAPGAGNCIHAGTIDIQNSEFVQNGWAASEPGHQHNVYVDPDTLIFKYNYSHGAVLGHELKTRGYTNYILYNRLTDETGGTASNNIDVPDGGLTYIIGNVIEKAATADAQNVIKYGEEGSTVYDIGGTEFNPIQELYVTYNSMRSDYTTSVVPFVTTYGDPNNPLTVKVQDNIVYGKAGDIVLNIAGRCVGGSNADATCTVNANCNSNNCSATSLASSIVTSNTAVTTNPLFLNQSAYDYHLLTGSPALGLGTDPGSAHSFSLSPTLQYVYDMNSQARTTTLDLGAFAGSQSAPTPSPTRGRPTPLRIVP